MPGKITNSAAIRITCPKRRGSVKRKIGLMKKAYSQGVTIPLQTVGVNMRTTFERHPILSFSRLLE
jgi:hypothetical protein